MKLDDFKVPWQRQQHDFDQQVDHVIKAVRSRMTWFDRVIWLRDLRESAVAVLLMVWLSYEFLRHGEWLAKAGALMGILSCAMIVTILNWARLTGRAAGPGQPLQQYCTSELERVDRQIWLLRNVNWWYTGPLYVSLAMLLLGANSAPRAIVGSLTLLLPVGWFIYWINQRAVRFDLVPLRDELASAMEVTDDQTVVSAEKTFAPEPNSLHWMAVTFAIGAWLALIALGDYVVERYDHDRFAQERSDGSVTERRAPKVSPFTDVEFFEQQILVAYEGQTYQWLEIDDIEVADLIASSKEQFGDRWQKRIAEDLVEVLWGMDHYPGKTVKLRLLNLETSEDFVVENAPMTFRNRDEIYAKRLGMG